MLAETFRLKITGNNADCIDVLQVTCGQAVFRLVTTFQLQVKILVTIFSNHSEHKHHQRHYTKATLNNIQHHFAAIK